MSQHNPTMRTNWCRMLTDLDAAGWKNAEVARHIEVPPATLHGWKDGAEPRHHEGERLIDLWRAITRRDRYGRPIALK